MISDDFKIKEEIKTIKDNVELSEEVDFNDDGDDDNLHEVYKDDDLAKD